MLLFLQKICVCQLAVILNQLNFMRVVGMKARPVEIMEPYFEGYVPGLSIGPLLPYAIPGLIGLIQSCYKSPVPASYLFQIEQREHLFHSIMCHPSQPFCVENRPSIALENLQDLNVLVVAAIVVIANQIGVFQTIPFHRGKTVKMLRVNAESAGGKRLNRINFTAISKNFFQMRHC